MSVHADVDARQDLLRLPAPPNEPYTRIIPLGGCGEIGRNMTLVETNDD
ncbi:MAG: hypothetical protein JOZ97_07275, partial [Candidatus Eremiobacteraeota bacterium]|nr:hypothetical protein [Candidatus Eremiobacteraeota bacterium]